MNQTKPNFIQKRSRPSLYGPYWRKADIELFQRRPTRPRSKAVVDSCTFLMQGVQLCLVESLRDVRDQIGRVFDADRQPDRGVENTYFLEDVSRNAGVGHACGQAGK